MHHFFSSISRLFLIRVQLRIAGRALGAHGLLNQQITMIEHFELAQASKRHLLGAEFSHDGQKILNTRCEFDQSKFIRLPCESFLDLKGSQLEALKDVCFAAHESEEFFLIINATNQWVRTVIGHKNLHPETWTTTESSCIPTSDRIIHSNILPYDPYWSQLRNGANTQVHFPSYMLQEAIKEEKTLKTKWQEWMDSGEKCQIGTHEREQQGTSKWFWEIQAADVELGEWIAECNGIRQVTWRGGRFVKKETHSDAEFKVVKRVNSHPNIVYGFGELCEETESTAYFMEYMSNELCSLIVDRKTRIVGDNKPPFSPHDSIDILLQFAKAMRHMHQEDVNVVHCDLKSANILISKIATSDNDSHYLVKVADFGSAQYKGNSSAGSAGFRAGSPTIRYAAPEVLQQLQHKDFPISFPHKIDVYSFGIVAFEVLTGENNFKLFQKSRSDFKKGVIEGTVRPPLHAECRKNKEFIQDKELISLIERCWHSVPSERPSFVEICEDLKKVRVRVSEKMSQSDPLPSRANSVSGPSSSPKVPTEGICDVDDLFARSWCFSKHPAPSTKNVKQLNM